MTTYIKDPDAVLDYQRDWSAWLTDAETITASTWTPDPSNTDTDLTIDSDSHTATGATLWLSGGTVGATYRITNHITTSAGRQNDSTIAWHIREL